MVSNCRHGPRQPRDAEERFWKDAAPTKRCPEAIKLWRLVSHETALTLPGVAELFPEGLPRFEPEPAPPPETDETVRDPESASAWRKRVRDFCEVSLRTNIIALEGKTQMVHRFVLDAESLARIQARTDQYLAELLRELDRAPVIDSQQPERGASPRLRLVVDNTREGETMSTDNVDGDESDATLSGIP